ncbi:ornithine decarboxylase-like [Uranotaenia lowii]|uniref:ornithine decarboxylase-like n=1 Tax=Uranotaenia lowii TaxID=190385 RepID=UPI002478D6E9|nr:ornithine decarboxylase-like [Uranotaenia lowii]
MSAAGQNLRAFHVLDNDVQLEDVIRDIMSSEGSENPFHLLDLDDLVRKHLNWLSRMPRVSPFYAVKCNDDEAILKTLATLGTGFDCASKAELEQILKLGVEPDRIIFAHPIKSRESLIYARENGVQKMTFDNEEELEKVKKYYPEAKLVLRIRHDSENVLICLGKKFGCDPFGDGLELIQKAKEMDLNVIGISFHVGCGALDAECFYKAIGIARSLFEFAKGVGYDFSFLDIGGGFPGDKQKPIDGFATAINRALNEYFPEELGVHIIAEPGRYYVGSAVYALTTIHGKKLIRDPTDRSQISHVMYYLNDGVFGSLFDWISLRALQDVDRVVPALVEVKSTQRILKTTIWGPTCDSTDIICENVDFPEHFIGDFVLFENIGAYGSTLSTSFNGFPLPSIRVFVRKDTWKTLADLDALKSESKSLALLQKLFQ